MNIFLANILYYWNIGALREKKRLIKKLVEEERITTNKVSQYRSLITAHNKLKQTIKEEKEYRK